MQVYQIARELGISNQMIMKTMLAWGSPIKSHMSKIPEELIPELYKVYEDLDKPDEPVKKATKPWSDKNWVPDVFRLDKRHAGFSPRFESEHKIDSRLSEGWQVADIKDYMDNPDIIDRQRDEEGKQGTVLKRKGMTLIELPDELMERKRKWLERKNERQSIDAHRREMIQKSKQISKQLGEDVNMTSVDE